MAHAAAIYQGNKLDKSRGEAENAGMEQPINAPGLGPTQRAILEVLKRRGATTIPKLAAAVDLNVETVRDHVRVLVGHGVVERAGSLRRGRGRPEIVFGLTARAERLFPRSEPDVLRGLVTHLRETGNEGLLATFFERYIDDRREEALARVSTLEGRERLEEVARILSELGFMAEVEDVAGAEDVAGEATAAESSAPALRLCHCPLRELVAVTGVPCRAEIGFVGELMGAGLSRVSYIPAGDECCSYRESA